MLVWWAAPTDPLQQWLEILPRHERNAQIGVGRTD